MLSCSFFFFFNDTATTEIYTLSLHDALPISIYWNAPEMQVLDDAGHPDGKSRLTAAGAAYDMYPSPAGAVKPAGQWRSEEHTSELQSQSNLVCRLLLEKKKINQTTHELR